MTRADWTYELPSAPGDSVCLEDYLVYDSEGWPVGRAFAVLAREGIRWLGIEREPLPTRSDRRVVPFEEIDEIDHENVAVHLVLGPDDIEDARELDPRGARPVRGLRLLGLEQRLGGVAVPRGAGRAVRRCRVGVGSGLVASVRASRVASAPCRRRPAG